MQTKGRRTFSPGARQRALRADGFRERNPGSSPAKRPRMETHQYQDPERRPLAKPAYKITPEPKVSAAVIEKKPVLLNPGSKSDFPPLPQRTPVQRQPPKIVPQTQSPVKTVPQPQSPVKTVPQTRAPVKTVPQTQSLVKTVPQKQGPVKTVPPTPAGVKTVPQTPAGVKTVPQTPTGVKTVPQTQAPVKTVPQKQDPVKNVPQKQEPVKTVPKPSVVQKQEAKPAAQKQSTPLAQKSEPKTVVENKGDKPVQAKASEQRAAPSEQSPIDRQQLNPVMSSVLKDELQQIMTKVTQELAKEPTTEAERLVVNKLNTVAGDDFKNALGLNVTKRILNLHNPLYVKLLFSGKPEAGCLQAFIAKYKISAFKRIASPQDTFAARLDAVADFDRLCGATEVTCGSAKVTVTPCYKFLACPTALDTMYSAKTDETKEKPDPSSNSTPQKQQNPDKTENQEGKTAEVNKVPIRIDNQKVVSGTKAVGETKTVTPVKNAKTSAPSHVNVNITIEAKSKSDDVKKGVTKSDTKTETVNNSEVNTKVTNQNNIVDKIKEVNNKSVHEIKVVDEQNNVCDEEMTDQDILALMSGGIVLDECSGSDDDN